MRDDALRAASLPPDSEVEIFPFRNYMSVTREQRYDIIEGGTISFMRPGSSFVIQGYALLTMLVSSYCNYDLGRGLPPALPVI